MLGFYTVACLAEEKTPAVSPFDRFFEPGLQNGTRTVSFWRTVRKDVKTRSLSMVMSKTTPHN